jgi:putative membrane protein
MRIWVKLAILAVVVAVGGGLRAQDKTRTDDKPADEKKFNDTHFVDHAYTAGQNEIISNQMALQRSRNEDVRKFAQKMLEDHSKNNQNLILIVSELRIAVPDRPLPEQEKGLQQISSNQVKDFDKEFMDHMVSEHEKAVKLFEQGSKELKNERLKEFAAKSVPTLKEHLKMAKDVQAKVASGAGAGRTGTIERGGTAERTREAGKALSDNEFVMTAASSGMAEVAIGKLAQEKAKNADVKKLADRVVADHSKANEELIRLARDAGINVPDKSEADLESKVKHFRSEADKNFDREFINHMVDSHTKGVDLFSRASKELKNAQLRGFAENTLPTIKEHLTTAKRLQEQLGRE